MLHKVNTNEQEHVRVFHLYYLEMLPVQSQWSQQERLPNQSPLREQQRSPLPSLLPSPVIMVIFLLTRYSSNMLFVEFSLSNQTTHNHQTWDDDKDQMRNHQNHHIRLPNVLMFPLSSAWASHHPSHNGHVRSLPGVGKHFAGEPREEYEIKQIRHVTEPNHRESTKVLENPQHKRE